jgi:voltage-gated potassium channel
MGPVIMAAALVPIGAALLRPGTDDSFVLIDTASWLVFLTDLAVHLRLQRRYLRSRFGVFDTVVVVLTFPWYLLPGISSSAAVLGLARLARVLRLILASGSTRVLRRLAARLGQAGLYALILILVCAYVVKEVEPASSGFATYGDAVWWGIVTFTTVGYGDLYPVTASGRVAAVLLMLGGVALIGLLAGSLAEFFEKTPATSTTAGSEPTAAEDPVAAELSALRAEIAELRSLLTRDPPPS